MNYFEKKIVAFENFDTNKSAIEYYLDLFQNVAGDHGTEMGVGLDFIRQNYNAFWVVSKTKIIIEKEVQKNQEVMLLTFPSKLTPLRVVRDYVIKNLAGEVLVKASSEWCVLDLESQAIRRLSSINHPKIEQFYGDNGIDFERFSAPTDDLGANCCVKVCEKDIDKNKHTNNVSYVSMAMETLEETEKVLAKTFEIHFISQSYFGDEIKICKHKTSEKEYFFNATKSEKIVFEAKLILG